MHKTLVNFQLPLNVFYSYSSVDILLVDELERHLQILQRRGLITSWLSRDIKAGTDYTEARIVALNNSSIILLLISPDFLASEYHYDTEMQRALELHRSNIALVLPILLRPTTIQGMPFSHLSTLPSTGVPITLWENRDEAFSQVATGVEYAVQHLLTTSTPTSFRTSSTVSPHRSRKINSREKSRLLMLDLVRTMWITDLLEPSLHQTVYIPLQFREQKNAVLHPWRFVVQEMGQEAYSLPQETRITQVYDRVQGQLLILGDPGVGKTLLLLELARELLDRAVLSETHPIPVILHLSPWSIRRPPLASWIVEELGLRYDVPSLLAKVWVQTEQLILLLDGLDEVGLSAYQACIQAINSFRKAHPSISLVICSRNTEYYEQPRRLRLHTAIVLQYLTPEQIDDYFTRATAPIQALKIALTSQPELLEIAKTPLMLTVLTQAYQEIIKDQESIQRRYQAEPRQIFAAYVQHVLQRRGESKQYTQQQIYHGLTHLARQLQKQNQSIFYLEQISQSWLPEGRLHQVYLWLMAQIPYVALGSLINLLMITLLFTSIRGYFFLLLYICVGAVIGGMVGKMQKSMPSLEKEVVPHKLTSSLIHTSPFITGGISGLSYGLVYSAEYGIRIGLIYGGCFGFFAMLLSFFLERFTQASEKIKRREAAFREILRKIPFLYYLIIGVSIGLTFSLAYILSTEITNHFYMKQGQVAAYAVFYWINYTFVSLLTGIIATTRKYITLPTESIALSWGHLGKSLINFQHIKNCALLAALTGVFVGLCTWLIQRDNFATLGIQTGLTLGLSYYILLALFRSLSNDLFTPKKKIYPNHGIRRAGQMSIFIGLIGTGMGWLICSFCYLFSYTIGLHNIMKGIQAGFEASKSISILVGICCGLSCGLLNGGFASIEYWILRLFLYKTGRTPWHFVRFLDYASEKILLRKVGAGYLFIHQMVLEYFAAQNEDL